MKTIQTDRINNSSSKELFISQQQQPGNQQKFDNKEEEQQPETKAGFFKSCLAIFVKLFSKKQKNKIHNDKDHVNNPIIKDENKAGLALHDDLTTLIKHVTNQNCEQEQKLPNLKFFKENIANRDYVELVSQLISFLDKKLSWSEIKAFDKDYIDKKEFNNTLASALKEQNYLTPLDFLKQQSGAPLLDALSSDYKVDPSSYCNIAAAIEKEEMGKEKIVEQIRFLLAPVIEITFSSMQEVQDNLKKIDTLADDIAKKDQKFKLRPDTILKYQETEQIFINQKQETTSI